MKNILLLILLISNIGFAQDKKLDSLLTVLNSHKEKDTIRIQHLMAVSNHHFLSDIDKAEPYLEEAIAIAKLLKDDKLIIDLRTQNARNYATRGLSTEALAEILEAIKILDRIESTAEEKIKTLNILSTVYRGYGDNEKSLEVALQVLELSKELPLNNQVPRYHYNAGQSYATLDNHKKAEWHFFKAQELAKEIGDKHTEIIMTSVLGDHYKKIGEYQKAKDMIKKSIPYYELKKQDRNLASSYRIL
ncbi:MAG: hypothetical protein HRT68_15885, partial [Flavobacteriaceae bacterium]|nr:hypothetical protein [Flavobacteriaceae bacterium]